MPPVSACYFISTLFLSNIRPKDNPQAFHCFYLVDAHKLKKALEFCFSG